MSPRTNHKYIAIAHILEYVGLFAFVLAESRQSRAHTCDAAYLLEQAGRPFSVSPLATVDGFVLWCSAGGLNFKCKGVNSSTIATQYE